MFEISGSAKKSGRATMVLKKPNARVLRRTILSIGEEVCR